ncbi:hypothetical protein M7I_7455 [Glarea lozoyensis 74030]|uniref:Uncharacterized protein n=1 Tax=Glarea lozoyensis (strain ATCC 74030 / MF5533) TaxID=1104152 RepID=H0EXC1_GLAL7|nr:hypothetical protein M7I_7455 [Glarea lozoyensis 74030]
MEKDELDDEKSLSEGTKRGLDDEFAFNGWRQYPENVILEPAAITTQPNFVRPR